MEIAKRRQAGVLLHPTSLPGSFGIGDVGPEAVGFLDWAQAAGFSVWQILPLGPTNGNSPYNAFSAFACNPVLISPERLYEDGLLTRREIEDVPTGLIGRVSFASVVRWKEQLLRRAWNRFRDGGGRDELAAFQEEHSAWLPDWALFAVLHRIHGQVGWWEWKPDLARRDAEVLDVALRAHADEISFMGFRELQFRRQWAQLRAAAHERGISILGDLPIYLAWDSAEVWTRPELFELDASGRPLAVAGVPPDYFSETGQLWNNPLYRWDRMAEEGYAWWIARLRANLTLADFVRLDHFRAFASYWRVPAGEETAVNGEWVPGPGRALFDALRDALGELPVLAEDLGDITPDVEELIAELALPGMRVLQFGFDDPRSVHAVHNLVPHCAVYTGTHDNDTTVGWFQGLDEELRRRVLDTCGTAEDDVHWGLIRLAMTSVAELAVVPVQDVLGLGSEARMNTPSVTEGCWEWRLRGRELTPEAAERIRRLVAAGGRAAPEDGAAEGE